MKDTRGKHACGMTQVCFYGLSDSLIERKSSLFGKNRYLIDGRQSINKVEYDSFMLLCTIRNGVNADNS